MAYPVTGNGESTSVYFQYGTTTAYGSVTPTFKIGSSGRFTTAYGPLGPLQPNTLYHYQLVTTSNRAGTNMSPDQTFTSLNITTAPPTGAAQGDSAPGTPTTGFFNVFSPPAINQNGEVAFYSTVAGGPTGKPLGSNPPCIWTDTTAGPPTLIAEVATTAVPGVAGAKWQSFSNPVLNDGGSVAFTGVMQSKAAVGVNGNNNSGVWSNIGGSLALVARQGSNAPGTSISGGPSRRSTSSRRSASPTSIPSSLARSIRTRGQPLPAVTIKASGKAPPQPT